MLGQYLITFREVLEAALITAILLSYLIRTERRALTVYVWYGVYIATALSLGLGASIWLIYGALPKTTQLLFEASAAFIAVIVLSSMIYWMAIKGRYLKRGMEQRIEAIATRGSIIGLISIAFIVVFRDWTYINPLFGGFRSKDLTLDLGTGFIIAAGQEDGRSDDRPVGQKGTGER